MQKWEQYNDTFLRVGQFMIVNGMVDQGVDLIFETGKKLVANETHELYRFVILACLVSHLPDVNSRMIDYFEHYRSYGTQNTKDFEKDVKELINVFIECGFLNEDEFKELAS